MLMGAALLGFDGKAVKVPDESWIFIPVPAIALLTLPTGLRHYVVVHTVSEKRVTYMDPNGGVIVKVSKPDFEKLWTGVLILIHGNRGTTVTRTQNLGQKLWSVALLHKKQLTESLIGGVVHTLLGITSAIYIEKTIDLVVSERRSSMLDILSFAMMALIILQAAINYYRNVPAMEAGRAIDYRLMSGYLRKIFRLPQNFFDSMRTGEILNRMTDASKMRDLITDLSVNTMINFQIIIFSMLFMVYHHWQLAFIVCSMLPVYVFLFIIGNKLSRTQQTEIVEQGARLESTVIRNIEAASEIKRMHLEQWLQGQVTPAIRTFFQRLYGSSVTTLRIATAVDLTGKFAVLALFWIGSHQVIDEKLSPGELLSFYSLTLFLTAPAASLVSSTTQLQQGLVAGRRFFETIDLKSEVDSTMLTNRSMLCGDIRFDSVTFWYGSRKKVFDNLSCQIPASRTTAIVGRTGSGKSSLASMLFRMHIPEHGQILIGNNNISQYSLQVLRRGIAIVPQRVHLFDCPLLQNITIGDEHPNYQLAIDLCASLGLEEAVQTMGPILSGGELQKLAIARALYRQPEILVLDEHTASLDRVSETQVRETIDRFVRPHCTIIMLTHKIVYAQKADHVIALDDQRCFATGTHEVLFRESKQYLSLWDEMQERSDLHLNNVEGS
jgi:ATP-binding cassette, subfamily C, bacteriocin exporter